MNMNSHADDIIALYERNAHHHDADRGRDPSMEKGWLDRFVSLLHITAETAATRWRGESMDYGLAVEVLLQQARRGRDVSAESRQAPSDAAPC